MGGEIGGGQRREGGGKKSYSYKTIIANYLEKEIIRYRRLIEFHSGKRIQSRSSLPHYHSCSRKPGVIQQGENRKNQCGKRRTTENRMKDRDTMKTCLERNK